MKSTKKISPLALLATVLIVGLTVEAMYSVGRASESTGVLIPTPPPNVCPWAYCPIEKTPGEGGLLSGPAGRLEFSGFSILPPRGEGWSALAPQDALRFGYFDVVFRKTIGPGQLAHAYVIVHPTSTGFADPAKILGADVDQFIKPGSRSLKTFKDSLAGASCIRWQMEREASAPMSTPGSRLNQVTFVSSYRGYLCSHPDAPAFVIEIGYIETVPQGTRRSLVPEEGDSFLKALALTPLGVKVSQFSAGPESRGVVLGHDALWVTEEGAGVVSRFDPKTGAIVARIPVGKRPEGFALGLGALWVPNWASDTISRIDAKTNKVVATISVGRGPSDVAVAQGSAWVTNEKDGSVSRLSPVTNQVIAVIHTGGRPVVVATGADAIWVENFESDEIWRIDPKKNLLVATIHVGQGRHLIAADDNAVWVSNARDDSVSRINPATNQVVATVAVGHRPMGLVVVGRALWVANFGEATILRIDPQTNQIKGPRIPVGESPFFLSGSGHVVWALSVWGHWQHSTLSRIDF